MIARLREEARPALIRAMHGRAAASNARRADRSKQIRRILVVRPDHLGDLLFATPALRMLREAFPEAHITGAVGPWGKTMWEGNPNLDELLTVRFPGIAFRHEGGPLGSYMLLGQVAHDLAAQHYDLGVILRFDHWWGAALMWAAGIPRRWGYDNPLTVRWLTSRVPYTPGRHEVEQDVRLAQAVINSAAPQKIGEVEVDRNKGIPALLPPAPIPPGQDTANAWLNSERRVIIHPGTGAANKLWTIAGWAEVANNLTLGGWSLALTGSHGEKPLCDAIVAATGNAQSIANLAGQTSGLGQLAWLLDRAGMVLGVDSGPLHIAAALGRPTLHLYGPSDESIWGPWGDPNLHRAFRAPGTQPTMRLDVTSQALEGGTDMQSITPDMVMSQVAKLEKYSAVVTWQPHQQ